MPRAKEFTVAIADRPGELGKCFTALASGGVNILAFQSYVEERESLVRFVPDDATAAQRVLAEAHMIFEQTDVAVMRVSHAPGALGQAAAHLGEGKINIDYSYFGMEPESNAALLVFGVDSVTRGVALLDELARKSERQHTAEASKV
jgi:hypothetical protein